MTYAPASISARTKRVLIIAVVLVLFVAQLLDEGRSVLLATHSPVSSTSWIWYASYALIALFFLGIGSLVWLYAYARQPTVATLLFIFCSLMACAFGTLSGSSVGDTTLITLGSSCSALAVLFFLYVLVRFPVDLFASRNDHPTRHRVLVTTLALITVLCVFSVSRSILYLFSPLVPGWWDLLGLAYYGVAGVAIVGITMLSARSASSVRTQQQTRLFFVGTLLAFVPILLLTVAPALLPFYTGLDGTRSMVFLIFFPLSLGYTVLRYNILVFDSYIRLAVMWVVGGVGLILLGYLLFAIGSALVASNVSLLLAGLIAAGVLGAPCTWWLARFLTERFFFPETLYYKHLLSQVHHHQGQELLNLQVVANLLVLDAVMTVKTSACVFVLNEESNTYDLIPPIQPDDRTKQARAHLLSQLKDLLSPTASDATMRIEREAVLIAHLNEATRPLFLSEARRGGARYLTSSSAEDALDPLLAPIRTLQGQLLGILVLDERGDHQPFAGPELEVIQQVVERTLPTFESARLYALATQQQEQSTKELARAYEQQRQLNELKDQLIINVSHELRTPLSEVSGYLDLLKSYQGTIEPTMQTMFVEKASHGCDELLELVTTILEAAQSGSALRRSTMQVLPLGPIVREELDHLDPRLINAYHIEEQIVEHVQVQADEQALRQVLRNLLSNALKYSPPHTTVTVSARVETAADQQTCSNDFLVRVCVKDEGPGIPADELPLLFGKFMRLQRDLSGSIRGTGLGLYISKQLVESMGGRIWVESTGVPGKGSCFFFTLTGVRQGGGKVDQGPDQDDLQVLSTVA